MTSELNECFIEAEETEENPQDRQLSAVDAINLTLTLSSLFVL